MLIFPASNQEEGSPNLVIKSEEAEIVLCVDAPMRLRLHLWEAMRRAGFNPAEVIGELPPEGSAPLTPARRPLRRPSEDAALAAPSIDQTSATVRARLVIDLPNGQSLVVPLDAYLAGLPGTPGTGDGANEVPGWVRVDPGSGTLPGTF